MAGIVDEPRDRTKKEDAEDLLCVDHYATALSEFIRTSATPITIGVQGEWGSGKTSLLNSVWADLADSPDNKLVWVNSWEHSLLVSPEESLLSIIREITLEITGSDARQDAVDKVKKYTGLLARGALRVGAAATLGIKGGAVADELFSETSSSIKELRKALFEVVEEMTTRTTNPYKRVVIFVDDLDRIEPGNAVRVLELLKNIFSVPHCVFVLAIDYQVVVKGLKAKFGELTEQNEWEFRAFFDKIIQLPFMMPMGNYNIGLYVRVLLQKAGFVVEEEYSETLSTILGNSVGGNPRSIKRLVNSIALIQLLRTGEEPTMQQKVVLFALVALQIAAPKVYDMLGDYPDFPAWDASVAFEITQGKEEKKEGFKEQFETMTKTEDFDEVWEQVLYRVCFGNRSLGKEVQKLSRLLTLVLDLCQKHDMDMAETIQWAMEQTSVTSVSATDAPTVRKTHTEADWVTGTAPWVLETAKALKGYFEQVIPDIDLRYMKKNIALHQRTGSRNLIALYKRSKERSHLEFRISEKQAKRIEKWLNESKVEHKSSGKGQFSLDVDMPFVEEHREMLTNIAAAIHEDCG